MRAPRLRARSSDSSTKNAAPSAITNPSRSASNGRDACAGSSLRVLSAPMRANAASVIGVIGTSVPPAITTSDDPSRMRRTPSPIAFVPAAHAVAMQSAGPVQPNCIEITPAVAFGIIIGTKNGLTRAGALLEVRRAVLLERVEPADAGRRDDRAAVGVGAPSSPGVLERVGGRGEPELRDAVLAARLLRPEVRDRDRSRGPRRRSAPARSDASNAWIGPAVESAGAQTSPRTSRGRCRRASSRPCR